MNYKTTELLFCEGYFGFHLAVNAKERRLCEKDCTCNLGEYMLKATELCQYLTFGRTSGCTHRLLYLLFTAQRNPKHPSYCKYSVSLRRADFMEKSKLLTSGV